MKREKKKMHALNVYIHMHSIVHQYAHAITEATLHTLTTLSSRVGGPCINGVGPTSFRNGLVPSSGYNALY